MWGSGATVPRFLRLDTRVGVTIWSITCGEVVLKTTGSMGGGGVRLASEDLDVPYCEVLFVRSR